jgi:Peptidase family M48
MIKNIFLLLFLLKPFSCWANEWEKFVKRSHYVGRIGEIAIPIVCLLGAYMKYSDRTLFHLFPDVDPEIRQIVINEARDMGIIAPENLFVKSSRLGTNGHAFAHGMLLGHIKNVNIQRFVIRHELSHIKHGDAINTHMLRLGLYLGFYFIGKKLNEYKQRSSFAKLWRHACSRFFFTTIPTIIFSKYIESIWEGRADREAIDSPEMRDACILLMSAVNMIQKKCSHWLYRIMYHHPHPNERIAQARRLFPE